MNELLFCLSNSPSFVITSSSQHEKEGRLLLTEEDPVPGSPGFSKPGNVSPTTGLTPDLCAEDPACVTPRLASVFVRLPQIGKKLATHVTLPGTSMTSGLVHTLVA